jgi:hypothetical protein
MQSRSTCEEPRSEYAADSAEYIAESIKRFGLLRDQLYRVRQETIDRVNKGQQELKSLNWMLLLSGNRIPYCVSLVS